MVAEWNAALWEPERGGIHHDGGKLRVYAPNPAICMVVYMDLTASR